MAEDKLVQRSSLSNPDPRFWGFSGGRATKELAKLFVIGLWDLQDQGFIIYKEPLNGGSGFQAKSLAMYYFTTPPQTHEISEPASVQIVPTQDGGKFVESQGNLFKDIRLAGTVGFRPNPISNELFPGLEEAGGPRIDKPPVVMNFLKDERGLDPKEVTGFDELVYLRNIFRAYFDVKADPEWANRIVMIFMNTKESELYTVEPINFTTSRDKSSPLSWRYNISLRTLFKWNETISMAKDPLNWYQSIQSASQTLRKVCQDIATSLHQIANLITYFANLPANLVNSIMNCAMTVYNGINAIRNAGASFADTVTQTLVNTLKSQTNELRSVFDTKYTPGVNDPPDGLMADDIGSARWALTKLSRCAETLLSLDSLWVQSKQVQVSDYSKAYHDEYGNPPYNSGSALTVQNIKLSASATEVEVVGVTDIRALAKQYLGDESKWKMLAILNNLKPPYVSAVRGDGVLAPGDKLLIPKNQGTEQSQVSRAINTDPAMEAQSPMMKKYGRDLLISDSGTDTAGADLQVGQRGDLATNEGLPNVDQAMKIKFSTEQGELAIHPDFGAKYPIGTKITMLRIQEFYISTRQTFLSDPRIQSINSMKIASDGDRVYTSSKLKLKDTNQELPVTFAVRR
jgi:hypothetical protein